MPERTVSPFGTWKSPITSDIVAAGGGGIGTPRFGGDSVYWTQVRPLQQGRTALVRRNADGSIDDVVPEPYSVRTRVHEYGGGAYIVLGDTVVFANHKDQRLYRLSRGGQPEAISSEENVRFADFCHDAARRRLICVREDHHGEHVSNTIAAISIDGGVSQALVAGNDFYAAPRLSPDGSKLAWLTWCFPNMPWDGTELWVADVRADGSLGERRLIAGGVDESVFQPEWSPAGVLHYVSDRSDWWNLYRCEGSGSVALWPSAAEFGAPLWNLGMSTYGFLSDGRIVCTFSRDGIWHLGISGPAGELREIRVDCTEIYDVVTSGNRAVFGAGGPARSDEIVELNPDTGVCTSLSARPGARPALDAAGIARPEPVAFPTAGGLTAHALFYRPTNPDFAAPAGELPPLIVMSHGGPTGAATTSLQKRLQYFTSRGFAVVDVNYGGSTGYGRAYRNRLRGKWGIVDVDDCVNAARYLAKAGLVDEQRLSIMGGSAGGYTTLAALTFTDAFRAGASYYGISDLEAMARDTHKFESRYLDLLVAPYPSGRQTYVERSPVHYTDRLSCPMILFQGLDDKVVPPNQADLMVAALRAKGLPVACIMFAGEAHGFRQAGTVKTALEAHFYFLSRIFGFRPADDLKPVEIENLK